MPSRPLTENEIKTMLGYMSDSRNRTLIILGVRTGFRISELLSLTLGDVTSDTGKIKDEILVKRCKMKGKHSSRTVVLHQQAKEQLHEYLVKFHADKSVTNRDDRLFPISRFVAHRIIKKAVSQAGLEGRLSTHSMRKAFAMKVYERTGKDIVATQRALGHASLASTTKYLSVDQDIIDQAILGD